MAYQKQTFKDNETVLKAEHLNHIEDGIVALENTMNDSNGVLIPNGAQVGQIIQVSKVDESGQPTEWKATDLPEGVSNYTELTNKPSINGVELSGNKTSADLGIGDPTDEQVANAVETWLDAHPEATTTVADGSITYEKLDGVEVVANQIFDPVDFRTNGVTKYLNANGIITSTTAIPDGYSGYMTSPYIEVLPNTDYAMNFTTYRMFFYDSSQVMLEAASRTEVNPVGGTKYYRITTPANTAYIRFTKDFSIDSGEHETWMICEGGVLFEEYFVGKKTALNGEYLNLKENTLDGAAIAKKTIPANRVKDFDILQQLFNYDDFVNNGVAGGNITAKGTIAHGNEASYHCSDFVPAKAGQVYTTNFIPYMSGKEYGAVACYGADKACLGVSDLNSSYQFTTLADTVYVRFGLHAFGSLDEAKSYMICEGTELFPGYAEGGDQIIVKNLLLYHSTPQNSVPGTILLDGSIPASKLAPADGLKVLCYGDSLTQNKYPAKVATLLNAEITDAGIGGNTIAQIYNRVGNYGTDYTVVTLMCGTNDNGGQTSCPLGTADDEAATDDNATAAETTYASRLKRLLDKIKTTHRGATFVIMPPFAHAWGGETFESVSVLMGEIAKQYKMPYLDIYHLCGWDGKDAEDKAIFMADDTHENTVGAQRIAELLAGFIKQLKGA